MPRTKLQTTFSPDAKAKQEWQHLNRVIDCTLIMNGIRSHKDLAERIGVSEQTIVKRFGLESPWKITELSKVAFVCDTTLTALISG